jgi:hypothetical protein
MTQNVDFFHHYPDNIHQLPDGIGTEEVLAIDPKTNMIPACSLFFNKNVTVPNA